jgi:hypothetical protein
MDASSWDSARYEMSVRGVSVRGVWHLSGAPLFLRAGKQAGGRNGDVSLAGTPPTHAVGDEVSGNEVS